MKKLIVFVMLALFSYSTMATPPRSSKKCKQNAKKVKKLRKNNPNFKV
jgi:hypothetical protein